MFPYVSIILYGICSLDLEMLKQKLSVRAVAYFWHGRSRRVP